MASRLRRKIASTFSAYGRASGTASGTVVGSIKNLPPVWVTGNPFTAYRVSGQWGTYQLSATDPEGQAITYSAGSPALPAGWVLPSNGLLQIPPNTAAGRYFFGANASDGISVTSFIFTVDVADNTAPAWTTAAAFSITQGTTSYQLVATDPDPQTVTYALQGGSSLPSGWSLSSSGLLTIPSNATAQQYPAFTVLANDGFISVARTFTVTVSAASDYTITETWDDNVLPSPWYDYSPVAVIANMPGTTNPAYYVTWGAGVYGDSTPASYPRCALPLSNEHWFKARVWISTTYRGGHLFYWKLNNADQYEGMSEGSVPDHGTFYINVDDGGVAGNGCLYIDSRRRDSASVAVWRSERTTKILNDGQPHDIVMHLVLNTVGQANGLVEVWVDGVKYLTWTNWQYASTYGGTQFSQFIIGTYRQGSSQAGVASVYIDNISLSNTGSAPTTSANNYLAWDVESGTIQSAFPMQAPSSANSISTELAYSGTRSMKYSPGTGVTSDPPGIMLPNLYTIYAKWMWWIAPTTEGVGAGRHLFRLYSGNASLWGASGQLDSIAGPTDTSYLGWGFDLFSSGYDSMSTYHNLVQLPKGRWFKFAILASLNTPTEAGTAMNADGVLRVWIDDVVAWQATNVTFTITSTASMNTTRFNIFAPVTNYQGATSASYWYMDDFEIWDGLPG